MFLAVLTESCKQTRYNNLAEGQVCKIWHDLQCVAITTLNSPSAGQLQPETLLCSWQAALCIYWQTGTRRYLFSLQFPNTGLTGFLAFVNTWRPHQYLKLISAISQLISWPLRRSLHVLGTRTGPNHTYILKKPLTFAMNYSLTSVLLCNEDKKTAKISDCIFWCIHTIMFFSFFFSNECIWPVQVSQSKFKGATLLVFVWFLKIWYNVNTLL